MNTLEHWLRQNEARLQAAGIGIERPATAPFQYLDGFIGRYAFRFIERGPSEPDIEIVDGDTRLPVPFIPSQHGDNALAQFDAAIDLVLKLA